MFLRSALLCVLLLSGLVLPAPEDAEADRDVAELEVDTLVSSVNFEFPLFKDLGE